jgi:hypothetical protein
MDLQKLLPANGQKKTFIIIKLVLVIFKAPTLNFLQFGDFLKISAGYGYEAQRSCTYES